MFSREPQRVFWQARFYDFNVWTGKKRLEKLRYMHDNPGWWNRRSNGDGAVIDFMCWGNRGRCESMKAGGRFRFESG
jgi:hypothetical protein